MTQNTTNDMMDSYFNSDQTEFQESRLHKITTNHPYMATLGLSVMTTGMLYRWWNKQDAEGNYVNHKYFAEDPSTIQDKTSPSLILFGQDQSGFGDKTAMPSQFAFQAWRKEGDLGAGQYVPKYLDGGHADLWDFVEAGNNEADQPKTYTYDDLQISDFNSTAFKEDFLANNGFTAYYDFKMPDGKGGQKTVSLKGVDPITNVIGMNELMDVKEKKDIDKSQWSQNDFARFEFITDIQASKDGYVEWSGYVPFYISTAKGDDNKDTFKCLKADWVQFRLYLLDSSSDNNSNRGVAIAKPSFAAPPVDPLGRKYSTKEDGRFSAFPEGSKAAEVVGELDMTFNEYTGKWEAGSQQMVGVVTQTIDKAQVVSAERLRNLRPEEMLKNPSDPNSHIIFGSGAAMPLNMQNGNPMQWTPNYASPSNTDINGKFLPDCPQKSDEKATFRVFNASAKSLDTNQYVLLNKIDGLWFAIDFPSGIEDASVTTGFDGRWDFTYLLTNKVHYFRDSGWKQIDSDQVERGLHQKYYADDYLNNNTFPTNSLDVDLGLIKGGYCQMSSFDQMDNLIGGTRGQGSTDSAAAGKNGLGPTNCVTGPNGEPMIDGEGYNKGVNTGGFFGCIFPDGYSASDIEDLRVARNYIGTATINASGLVGEEYASASTTSLIGDSEFQYFTADGIAKDALPFNNGLERQDYVVDAFKVDNAIIPMFDNEDTSLDALPADIALNAGPSGENGQPIKNIHFIDRIYDESSFQNGAKRAIRDFFTLGQNWIHKKFDEGTKGVPDLPYNSFYDFSPRVPNRIMFRPLKDAAYMQYGNRPYVASTLKGTRQYHAQQLAQRMTSNVPAVGEIARLREYNGSTQLNSFQFEVPNVMGNISSLWNSFWGLQLNVDIPGTNPSDQYLISPKAYVSDDTGARFHHGMWGAFGQTWLHGGTPEDEDLIASNPPWRGSDIFGNEPGAVGIIGAVATCTANTEIIFSTDQTLGCWSYGISSFVPGAGGFSTLQSFQYASWGLRNGYRDFNTTNLYVKVYHQWPREQTIYDPRYYAVHHFNAGIIDPLTDDTDPDSYKIDFLVEKVTQKDPDGVRGSSKQYNYYIAQKKYDCDLRIPTAKALSPKEDPDINELIALPLGSKIYQTVADAGFLYEYIPRSQWLIDAGRRGKLLPYNYMRRTVGIPKAQIILPDYSAGVDADGVEQIYANGGYAILNAGGTVEIDKVTYLTTTAVPFQPLGSEESVTFDPFVLREDVLFIVKNPGKEGYKVGDTFILSDKLGVDFEMIVDAVDSDGRVKSLLVSNTGYDFSYTAFSTVQSDRPVSFATTGASVFDGGAAPSELGQGFNLHVVRGYVFDFLTTDEKPALATGAEFSRLSIKSNSDQDKRGQPGTTEPYFGLESGEQESTLQITNKSSNNKYDLFFHFHNDIGHTFFVGDGSNGTFYSASRDVDDEQFIDLIISTK